MVRIVFIGDKNSKRLNILYNIKDCYINIIDEFNDILNNLPNDVIDLFILETDSIKLGNKLCNKLNNNDLLNHIPIILINNDISENILSDLIVSDNVSDKEFLYQVKTLLKMKLMDDELKKEKILLELKVKDRTNQLEEKANRLNVTLNSIGDGVIVTDKNGLITLMNPVAKELTKLDDSDFMLNYIDDVLDITYKDEKIYLFDEVIKCKKTFYIKDGSKLKSKKSDIIRISDSASLILNRNGELNGVVIVFRDITKEYELRKETIESELKYRRIYYHVPDVVYTMSIDGIFTSMNDASIFGYTNDEIIGNHIKNYIPYQKDLIEISKNIKLKINNDSKITQYKIHIRRKDGKIVPIDVKTQMIFDDKGNPLEIFGIVRDISDKEESNRIIKESQERYKNMFENMHSGVWVFETEDGNNFYFIEWNKSASEMEQILEKDVINKELYEVFPYLEKDTFKDFLNTAWRINKPVIINNYKFEYNNKTKGWRKFFIYKLSTTNEIVVIKNMKKN